jgi:hypothetical protein
MDIPYKIAGIGVTAAVQVAGVLFVKKISPVTAAAT